MVHTKKVALFAMIGLAVLALRCDKKTTVSYGLPAISGMITWHKAHGTTAAHAEAAVTVDGTRLVPVVAINTDTLDLTNYSGSGEYMWNSEWEKYNVNVGASQQCQLQVYQSDGNASSPKLPLPAGFSLTAPADSSRLVKGNPLVITWPPVADVDRYLVEVYVYYVYNNYDHFTFDTTIIAGKTATSMTLPASTIFPSPVDTVLWGNGSVTVDAEAGPDIGRECKGNISGNGIGYFLTSSADGVTIRFGSSDTGLCSPSSGAELAKRLSAKWLLEQHKRMLGN
jgi:hypothetical protein